MSNILVQLSQMSKLSLKQKSHDNKYDTNRILYQSDIKNSTLTYYLPTYIQLTFQSISNIDYQQLNSRLLCLIVFQINVCGLDNFLINYLKNNIVLYFNQSNKIKLSQQYTQQQQHEDQEMKPQVDMQEYKQYLKGQLQFHYLKFTVKKDFITRIVADVDWTPFQLLNFILTIQPRIQDCLIEKILKQQKLDQRQSFIHKHTSQQVRQFLLDKYKNEKKKMKLIALKFNLMDCKNKAQTINCPLNKSYGNYKVAINKLNTQFTFKESPQIIIEQADQINKKQQLDATQILIMKQNKVKSFQNGHFIIPVYKIPNSTFATILVPMLLLTIINLCIFNQTDRLTGRIANLGALILAFLAIFPVIREQIPRNPKVTKIQFMVYLLVGTDLLCFIQSVRIRGKDQPIANIWQDAIFIVAVAISCFVFIVMIILFILHKCRWEPAYLGTGKIIGIRSERFDHKKWKNQECDSHFMRFFDQEKIKPLHRKKI